MVAGVRAGDMLHGEKTAVARIAEAILSGADFGKAE